jgi:hypothetical protein
MHLFTEASVGGYWPGSFYSTDWDSLVQHLMLSPLMDEATSAPNPYFAPLFIGRVAEPQPLASTPHPQYAAELVMAELSVGTHQPRPYPIPHRIGSYSRFVFSREWSVNDWQATLASEPLDLFLVAPAVSRLEGSRIDVELTYSADNADHVVLTPPDTTSDWQLKHCMSTAAVPGDSAGVTHFVKRYHVDDWAQYRDEISGEVRLQIARTEASQDSPISVHVTAEIVFDPARSGWEEWTGWR